jgi:hypothetical protein
MNTTYHNPDYIQAQVEKEKFRNKYMLFLGILLALSAVLTCFMNTSFVHRIHYILKIPIYSVLGIIHIFIYLYQHNNRRSSNYRSRN